MFGDNAVRNALDAALWVALFTDKSATGFILRYRKKANAALDAIKSAKAALQSHRNLDEDYCLISSVGIEDVAVCADVEVKADADIERVQAEIWFRIEQYLSPPVPFRTLQELQGKGEAVEDIFDGPALDNGFIMDGDLQAASLRAMLRGSDIINLLMDIDGVIAVNQLRMTKYDSEGAAVMGAADPTWSPDGLPIYDPSKISAAWLLAISPRHQPRFYLNQSRFLFYKNGLPFLPRIDEATDVLNQLRGEADRPKNPDAPNDLPIPAGLYRKPADYCPVQYSFPLAYGIGPAGLPASATPARQAQARDLKAYLMAFEQLIGNALEQLAHTADLFSLDPAIAQTYFVKAFDETIIKGYGDLVELGQARSTFHQGDDRDHPGVRGAPQFVSRSSDGTVRRGLQRICSPPHQCRRRRRRAAAPHREQDRLSQALSRRSATTEPRRSTTPRRRARRATIPASRSGSACSWAIPT